MVGRFVAGVVAGAALLGQAGPAFAASPVTCGSTVTGEAYLAGDLSCPDGITLRDATLDLRGHQFTGLSTALGATTVRNGTLAGPVRSDDGGSVSVRDVRFLGGGVWVVGGGTADVRRADFRGDPAGANAVFAFQARRVTITGSTFTGYPSQAVQAVQTPRVDIRDSVLRGNGTAVSCAETVCGVSGTTLRDNDLAVSGWQARISVLDSVLRGNRTGYSAGDSTDWDLVRGNTFRDNGVAVRVGSSYFPSAVRVLDNVFTGNASAIGTAPDGEEITYRAEITGNLLTRNGDAIRLDVPGASIGGNRALDNTGHGIYAPGAVDLGGNVARRNGIEPQCTGVVC